MGLIPNEIINTVIYRSDIVETVGSYIQLKKAGRNYKARCPFHHEKTPSFVVNPDKQIFHCFGCGVGGNAVAFVMRQEHLEFPEAVRFLAAKCGVTIPDNADDVPNPSRQLREDIYKVNEMAVGYYHDLLLTSREIPAKAARDYLKARGVNLETVQKFRLGLDLDWPKQLLFAAAIPVNYVLFRSAMPLLGVYAAVTIFHNVQYHRLVWFYNQNKYAKDATAATKYGLATLVNARWITYVAAAALYAIIFDVVPRFVLRDGVGLMNIGTRNHIIFSFFAAPGLLHYWVDGHIWKVRSDPSLRTYLQL